MSQQSTNELFWAFVIALVLASILAALAYVFPGTDAARHDVNTIADAMVTGALGFFAGRATAARSEQPGAPK